MLLKFFFYSYLGCGLETVWSLIKTGKLTSRRMLVGLPMCPVYGIGAILMELYLSNLKNNILALYLMGALLASSVEFVYFSLARLLFSVKVWDYSDKPLNFMGGICGEYTIRWGLAAVIFMRYISPMADMLVLGINPYTELVITVFLCVVTAADAVKTTAILLSFKKGVIGELPECFRYMKKIS